MLVSSSLRFASRHALWSSTMTEQGSVEPVSNVAVDPAQIVQAVLAHLQPFSTQMRSDLDALRSEQQRLLTDLSGVVGQLRAGQSHTASVAAQAAQTSTEAAALAQQTAALGPAVPAVANAEVPAPADPLPYAAKPSLKGPVYSGDTARASEEVHGWASRMDDHLTLIGQFGTPLGPVHVGQCLEGSAQVWYHSKKTASGSAQPYATWTDMRADILQDFSYTRSGRDAFRQLAELTQRGSVRDFTKRFRGLLLLVDPKTVTDDTKQELYLKGLSQELRGHVEAQRPETLDQTITSAEALDQCFTRRGDSSRGNRQEPKEREPADRDRNRQRDRQQSDRRDQRSSGYYRDQRQSQPQRHDAGKSYAQAARGPTPMEVGTVTTQTPVQKYQPKANTGRKPGN